MIVVMEALLAELDLDQPLRQVAWFGGAFLPRVLSARFLPVLGRELAEVPFEPLPDRAGPYEVRQHGGQFFVHGTDIANWPAIDRLRRELVELVHAHGTDVPGAARWEPNEAAVQRYPTESGGIGVHRDGKRYGLLIAIITVEGSARLGLCADREGTVSEQWHTTPGSMMVLRAPGLDGVGDGRPLHRLRAPTGSPRTSLTLRMKERR